MKRYIASPVKNNRFNKSAPKRRQFPGAWQRLARGPDRELAASHAIAAIQAFVAGAAANGDMSAGVAGRGVALHAPGRRIDGIQTIFRPGDGCCRNFSSFSRGGVAGRGMSFGYDTDIA